MVDYTINGKVVNIIRVELTDGEEITLLPKEAMMVLAKNREAGKITQERPYIIGVRDGKELYYLEEGDVVNLSQEGRTTPIISVSGERAGG